MVAAEGFSLTHLEEYFGVDLATEPRGAPIVPNEEPIEASEIRANAYSIGDYNPLYTNPAHARRSRFGGVIAPPYFLYAIDRVAPPSPHRSESGADSFAVPGARHVYGGNDWTFHAPIREGDVVTVQRRLLRIEEKTSEYAGRSAVVYGEVSFRNQRDELLASAIAHLVVSPLREAASRGKYRKESAMRVYSDEDQQRIAADKAEGLRLRGAEPRYFEDTNEGDVITPTVQGPLWDSEIARFSAGWRMGPKDTMRGFPREPEDAMRAFAPDPWTGGHTNVTPNYGSWEDRAMPRGFDSGMQRHSWLLRAVTSWMGDDADLKSLRARLVRPYMTGDCNYYTGRVVAKRVEDGEHLIDCELRAHDQEDRTNVEGECTIALPSRTSSRS